jgi:hypothetical protein
MGALLTLNSLQKTNVQKINLKHKQTDRQMKNQTKNLTVILMACLLTILTPQTGFMETITNSTTIKTETKGEVQISHSNEQTATFFQTLLRTPFAIMSGAITFVCVILVGFLEFWGYLFSGFNYHFPITHEIMDIGWKTIVAKWWWHPAVTWHLVVSILLVGGIGAGSRR